ncbi:hypothetical protein [Acinetobacter venetianus]|uniref:hypothetical protein n=1 Tax=Acinetobacter venetianus TaxID=52133 RepID=UPI000B32E4C8|nr:hypothetical protein [Acinetobacter venetianus]
MNEDKHEKLENFIKLKIEIKENLDQLVEMSKVADLDNYTINRFYNSYNILENLAFPFFIKNSDYLEYEIGSTNFLNEISRIKPAFIFSDNNDKEKFTQVTSVIDDSIKIFKAIEQILLEKSQSEILIKQLEYQVQQARETVANIESAKLAVEGQKTEEIYSEASKSFLTAARNYEVFFYMLIGAALIITVICLAYFPYSEATKVNFIFSKLLTATLVITLGTLFLRKAAHLRKLHEQAHQTSLELQALPLYLVNVTPDHQAEIYKDLASKYFGKELDKTQHDKIGDLMNEQVKTSLEVFKTSSELMKSMKPSTTKEEDAKDKNKNE